MRLDKFLANMGKGSRKEVRLMIFKGAVSVNGQEIKIPDTHIEPQRDSISFSGEEVRYQKERHLMMNKPEGVVSATRDTKEKTVLDLLPKEWAAFEFFPAGRLDKDTTGLLLLTTDGQLAHNILSPKKHVAKIYEALISEGVTEEDVRAFKEGVALDDGYLTRPAELIPINEEKTFCKVIIHEGKYHQIKRMFASRGKKVLELRRTAMGALQLDESLPQGAFRELREEEVAKLFEKEKER